MFVTDIMIGVVFTLAVLAVRLSESEDLKSKMLTGLCNDLLFYFEK